MKSQDASYMALRAQTEMKVHQLVAYIAIVECGASVFVSYSCWDKAGFS